MVVSVPKAVIFDWDGTLVDSWGAITEALNKVRAMEGLETWTLEEARVKSAYPLRVSFPQWFGNKWEVMRDAFYAHLDAVHVNRLTVMPGAPELLAVLQARAIPLVVVSSKRNLVLRKEVEALGWGSYFKAVVGSMDCARDKPDRMPVDYALAQAGREADDPAVWFVGDTHLDVECALRSGVTPVLVGATAAHLGVRARFSDCRALAQCFESPIP